MGTQFQQWPFILQCLEDIVSSSYRVTPLKPTLYMCIYILQETSMVLRFHITFHRCLLLQCPRLWHFQVPCNLILSATFFSWNSSMTLSLTGFLPSISTYQETMCHYFFRVWVITIKMILSSSIYLPESFKFLFLIA